MPFTSLRTESVYMRARLSKVTKPGSRWMNGNKAGVKGIGLQWVDGTTQEA